MKALVELIGTTPEGIAAHYELGEHTVIGRSPECQIVLADGLASRRHCLIEHTPDGQFYVEDNKSANGTLLNGQALRSRTQLRSGDSIQIGSTVLVLRLESSNRSASRPGTQACPSFGLKTRSAASPTSILRRGPTPRSSLTKKRPVRMSASSNK